MAIVSRVFTVLNFVTDCTLKYYIRETSEILYGIMLLVGSIYGVCETK